MKLNHPEIPFGHYCYSYSGEKSVHGIPKIKCCSHWHSTEKGAFCDLINEEHTDGCMFHLLWDQVKECGMKVYEDEERDEIVPSKSQGVEKTMICHCGKKVDYYVKNS